MSTTNAPGTDDAPSLSKSDARWMSWHADELVEDLPRHGAEWRWRDTELSRQRFAQLRERALIEMVRREHSCAVWRTPRRTVRALARYADADVDDVGQEEWQASLVSPR